MSAFVFAGAAQFAALELWGAQVSIITLVVTVFAINARHLFDGGVPLSMASPDATHAALRGDADRLRR
jgi:predicted branched-subunit amino acid permease